MPTDLIRRSVRAEVVRTGGRSRLWTVFVPVAVGVPMVITFVIAAVAEMFARIPGQVSILQVSTSNAAYWVITVTVIVAAAAAADGQSSESLYRTRDHIRLALPYRWSDLVGKWLFYGTLSAALAAATTAVVLLVLPMISGLVYGEVSLTDPTARRLLWTVPVYAFFAAGAGVGLGAIVRSRVGAVGAILLWAYVIETAAGYLPSGASLQRFMPVLNAVFATGQDIVLMPPWGQNAALAYSCVIFTAIFALSFVGRRQRK
ncbi:ABC transporter permease [Mycolicibacterium celeriflavum]|uniref:ABC transporter n=1 Tax=Mycolicibacterium celeriflavum TaxID=1249101 RepID=A0A1X0BV88_MYCCF|nr:ABC transporter permease [Mycolicibacterium celeriflavum]MCV7240584.1 ABC transporter permease [Mycolicibacterium celeriflavum]ORA48067.1 ABC transporter permease [Mycolicibacterium celeriflavum]BBY43431.1 ABC transporter [Mycolicibacterium celeriflavum]